MNDARALEADPTELASLFDAQRRFFDTGATLPYAFRVAQLRALVDVLQRHARRIDEAVWTDLHKPPVETYGTETSLVANDAKHAIKHLRSWMLPVKHTAALVAQPARTVLYPQPVGLSFVMGAWNYPIQLTLQPLVGALAAGCPVVAKPSELAPASSALMAELVAEAFSPEVVALVEGGADTASALLDLPFDHVFYTGGPRVGRIVAEKAAKHLARVTLELGGKSPCIVGASANLETAANRIAWGRFMNAGQSCIAPDYLLVHSSVHDRLVELLADRVRRFYGPDPKQSPDLARIVHPRHVDRIAALIDPAKVAFGGQVDRDARYVAPTVLVDVTPDDPVMQEEVFGPVLPVLRIEGLHDVLPIVRRHPNPLACYLFSEDEAEKQFVVQRIAFGNGAINNTMMQAGDPSIPFGGLGGSGRGAYHGKHGFDAFTHVKGVLEANSSALFDLSLRYPPYAGKLGKLKWILG